MKYRLIKNGLGEFIIQEYEKYYRSYLGSPYHHRMKECYKWTCSCYGNICKDYNLKDAIKYFVDFINKIKLSKSEQENEKKKEALRNTVVEVIMEDEV